MVDRAVRDHYAELLRHFASGRMTNRDYEERTEDLALDSEDPAVKEIWLAIWTLYDDIREHRLTGRHRLTGATRREVARCILFLQSDQEYGWPDEGIYCITSVLSVVGGVAGLFATLTRPWLGAALVPASLVVWSAARALQDRQRQQAGDHEAWPFLRLAHLDEARRQPKLLACASGK